MSPQGTKPQTVIGCVGQKNPGHFLRHGDGFTEIGKVIHGDPSFFYIILWRIRLDKGGFPLYYERKTMEVFLWN